jgi:hypothetical protein
VSTETTVRIEHIPQLRCVGWKEAAHVWLHPEAGWWLVAGGWWLLAGGWRLGQWWTGAGY